MLDQTYLNPVLSVYQFQLWSVVDQLDSIKALSKLNPLIPIGNHSTILQLHLLWVMWWLSGWWYQS
jgi:hypothetical protein